ncbi:hypothetical protein EV368DRAFT_65822 [Lentinula lateritia]|nr:hypothetical protein EV368DRAFT_65822 [Lentinula lateritia]
MSSFTTNSASITLYQLVAYLTRPLIEHYPSQTILQLQFFLHANLVSQFVASETSLLSPFTLFLTPVSLPPTPVYAACLQAGVAWPQWIRALGGNALYVCVMENSLKVRIGETGDVVTVWSTEPRDALATSISSKVLTKTQTNIECESPMGLKLRAMLDSVRTRSTPTDTPRLPTSCLSHTDVDANDSDSESDTESTTSSSLFSETSSTDSMSSISSAASSPAPKTSNLSVEKVPVYVPRHRRNITSDPPAPAQDSTLPQRLSRSQRRLARATVDKAKVDVCRYTYQGGQTLVMTGGVMLGGVKPSTEATRSHSNTTQLAHMVLTTTTRPPATKKTSAMLGSDSSRNWRARV